MNPLTVNLHLMLATFYRPTATRRRILIEDGAFPSDRYAVRSQIELHRLDPDDTLVRVAPRDGDRTLRTDDIQICQATTDPRKKNCQPSFAPTLR